MDKLLTIGIIILIVLGYYLGSRPLRNYYCKNPTQMVSHIAELKDKFIENNQHFLTFDLEGKGLQTFLVSLREYNRLPLGITGKVISQGDRYIQFQSDN